MPTLHSGRDLSLGSQRNIYPRKFNLCHFGSGKGFWLRTIGHVAVTWYDLFATQCFWLTHHNDSFRWFAVSSPKNLFAVPVLWVGVAKGYTTKLGSVTCGKECDKYDLLATQCLWLTHHNDSSKWFAISSPHTYLLSQFLWVGVAKG
jgi:hypothetical protein